MTTLFIAGSMNIKHLDVKVKERIDKAVSADIDIFVGDAEGADLSIQHHLFNLGTARVTVYCSGTKPRNNFGDWPVRVISTKHSEGSRAFFTAKDIAMAESADFGLMVWDTKSTGTLSNVIELLTRGKKSVVFINKSKSFQNVGNVEQLEALTSCMSDTAKRKADEKIRLFDRIFAMKHLQAPLFESSMSDDK